MKKPLFILIILISLGAVNIFVAAAKSDAKHYGAYEPEVIGTWAEMWGKEGWDSNVNYIDTIHVRKDEKDRYYMYCTTKNYFRYDEVSYDGNTFKFRMSYSSSMNSDFNVRYIMRFVDDPNVLEGESLNSRDDHNFVRMIRVK